MWKDGAREAVSGETPHSLSTFRTASPRLWALSHRAQEVAEGDSELALGMTLTTGPPCSPSLQMYPGPLC